MKLHRPIIGCTTYQKKVDQVRPMNVYGLMPSYTEAITKAGGIPLLIPLSLDEKDLNTILGRVDGLLLPGGGDIDPALYDGSVDVPLGGLDRERDRTELFLCQIAVALGVPFLAICRGLQLFNVALGGALIEDLASMKPEAIDHDLPDYQPRNYLAHSVTVLPDSALFQHLRSESCKVNSIHHQAIRTVAPGLKVTALAPDGIIEAAELPDHPFGLGVQWHPENLVDDDPAMLSLFKGLVTAARANRLNSKTRLVATPALSPEPRCTGSDP
jgi:putative glutamine amidotransferase